MSQFRDTYSKLVPKWLSEGDGGKVLYSLHTMLDASRERMRQGLYAKLPSYAPEDALACLSRDRKIIRGLDESAESFAPRLIRFLSDHRVRGNPYALMDQIYAYLQTDDTVIRTVDRRGNWYTRAASGARTASLDSGAWDWDGTSVSQWARFWVIIYTSRWEIQWAAPYAGTTTATNGEIQGLRTIIKDWKPGGTRCEWIISSHDSEAFEPSSCGLGWLRFDGTTKYVSIGDIAALDFERSDDYTISAWIRNSANTTQGIVTKRDLDVSPFMGYALYRSADLINLIMRCSDGEIRKIEAPYVADGQWHLVTARHKPAIADGGDMWIDGVDRTSVNTGLLTGTAQTAIPLQIGDYSSGTWAFNGDIGTVGIWNRCLSDTEMVSLYTLGRGRNANYTATSPLLWMRPGLDTYPTILDYGSGGNDGTMTGMVEGDLVSDIPGGEWGTWSDTERPVRFIDARYWSGR